MLTKVTASSQEPYNILSIDDGGLRTIVAAEILGEFEDRTNKKITDLFDAFVGSSAGGLAALMLNSGKYSAKDVVQQFEDSWTTDAIFSPVKQLGERTGTQIFADVLGISFGIPGLIIGGGSGGLLGFLIGGHPGAAMMGATGAMGGSTTGFNIGAGIGKGIGKSVEGLFYDHEYAKNYKYVPDGLEKFSEKLFAKEKMSEGIRDILVPCYDISNGQSVLFTNTEFPNYLVGDVAAATLSAPTFFPPRNIETKLYSAGSIVTVNPAQLGLERARTQFQKENINLVSFGGGELESASYTQDQWESLYWSSNTCPVSSFGHYQEVCSSVATTCAQDLEKGTHFRLALQTKKIVPWDANSREDDRHYLKEVARRLIEENTDYINTVCRSIDKNFG